MSFTQIGYDDAFGRALFAARLGSFDEKFPEINVASPYFACLLCADFTLASVSELSALASTLIVAGCSYYLCWGPDCERAHDIFDEVAAADKEGIDNGSVIMTTWHSDESLDDALHFFLTCSIPDDKYIEMTGSSIAIEIGDNGVYAQLIAAMKNPREFVRKVYERDEGAA